jgi:hypothetical protein
MFFFVVYPMNNRVLFDNIYVGPYRPPGSSPIQRRGKRGVIAGVVVFNFETIEKNLEGLTMNIPDATIDYIPRHYQRHIVGVFTSIIRLVHRVAWEVTYYRGQHP